MFLVVFAGVFGGIWWWDGVVGHKDGALVLIRCSAMV